ncbi:2,3-diketo-5-methylthio-1-phosphopentane phosphatase [Viridothelium virens]|uniref:2,3-diketo-5-methylthio-1-phosphopentane phosphatase n=1 Tax=Viridothelium virens TaxID=1048519 RepID=A0A6A6GW08_VIRVR|nr:2,3-diketo-5-methylthio-1-phosphopentane phosphatase [Viridothelium virens]
MDFLGIRCVLLDIEGTICEISFVKDVLFPYALKALPAVAHEKWDHPEFVQYRDEFPPDARQSPDSFIAHVDELTAKDVKISYLKDLQGYLWQTGYKSGAYSTPLFSDVPLKLQAWHDEGITLAIYSSGSVLAQKLLFEHVQDGKGSTTDLRYLISAWFDTVNAGPKYTKDSYEKIAGELGTKPESMLFISDNAKELDAAKAAGMYVLFAIRPGNPEAKEVPKYPIAKTLEDIVLRPD